MVQTPQSIEELSPEQRKELEEKLKNMSPEELAKLQQQQCIFCQIINGKIPSKKVYEDDTILAILDINPAAKGHIILLPKEHYAIMPQVPDEVIGHLFKKTKFLSQALLRSLKCGGTSVLIANGPIAGQRSQHFLVHLIPRKEGDKLLHNEERIIEKEMQQKVITSVQDKLNSLLGVEKQTTLEEVKREKVSEKVEEKEDSKVAEDTKEEETEGSEEPEDDSDEEKEESEEDQDEEEDDDEDEDDDTEDDENDEKDEDDSEDSDDEEPDDDEADEDTEEDTEEEDDGDANLDDIANLFK